MEENGEKIEKGERVTKREEFLQERSPSVLSKSAQVKLFDKTLILIATGALALSLTFIKDIAPVIKPETLGYLKGAWSCLCSSLLLILVAYLLSKFAYDKAIKDLWGYI